MLVWDHFRSCHPHIVYSLFPQKHSSVLTILVLLLPGVIFSHMTCGLVSSLFLSDKKEIRAWAYTKSPHSTLGFVSFGAISSTQEVVIFAFAFATTKNDHPRVSFFSKRTRLFSEVLEIRTWKCQLA